MKEVEKRVVKIKIINFLELVKVKTFDTFRYEVRTMRASDYLNFDEVTGKVIFTLS